MERTDTSIGSLHFVYCLTEQVKNNLPLRILHCNYPQYHRFFVGKWKTNQFCISTFEKSSKFQRCNDRGIFY